MKLGAQRDESPDLNMTPMIDVVFLLLIFFMVSTTFSRTSAIQIDLPEATDAKTELQDRQIEIAIDAEGRFHINGKRLLNRQLKTLKQALAAAREALKTDADPVLIISADGKTPHQAVITAMDAARQLDMLQLTFATRDADSPDN